MMDTPMALRAICGHDSRSVDGCTTCEAADEIERLRGILNDASNEAELAGRPEGERVDKSMAALRRETERLRVALGKIRDSTRTGSDARGIAYAALEPPNVEVSGKAGTPGLSG